MTSFTLVITLLAATNQEKKARRRTIVRDETVTLCPAQHNVVRFVFLVNSRHVTRHKAQTNPGLVQTKTQITWVLHNTQLDIFQGSQQSACHLISLPNSSPESWLHIPSRRFGEGQGDSR